MSEQTKTQQALASLKQQIATFNDSGAYKSFLRQQSLFHTYSFRNAILIGLQCPHATYTRGFKGWLKLGRVVNKGSKGITILAPRPFKKEVEKDDGLTEEKSGVYFAAVSVFDISQTSPLPGQEDTCFQPVDLMPTLDDERGEGVLTALQTYLTSEGITYQTVDDRGHTRSAGWYDQHNLEMFVRKGSTLDMLTTAIHEVCHHETKKLRLGLARNEEEVVVESAAYITLAHFNLDVSKASVPYIGSWLQSDPKGFERSLGVIQRLANHLIGVLTPSTAPAQAEEAIAA